MSTNLAAALRVASAYSAKPIKLKKPPRPKWPHKQRMEYYRDLLGVLARMRALVQRDLVPQLGLIVAQVNVTRPEDAPIRNDAPGDAIQDVVASVTATIDANVDDAEIEMLAQRNVVKTSVWHANELQKQVQHVAAINLYDDTTGLLPHLEMAVAENVRLIKGLKSKTLDEIKGVVLRGALAGVHQSVIAEQIELQFGMSKKRAALIATDQTGKLNSELNSIRQQRLGVRRYRWSSSKDERVRKRHRQLNGTVQEWAKPPLTDERTGEHAHPGQPIRCRCQPIPIIDDVLADAGLIAPTEVETTQPQKGRTKKPRGPVDVPPMPPANVPPSAGGDKPRKRKQVGNVPPSLPQPAPANVPPPSPPKTAPKPPALAPARKPTPAEAAAARRAARAAAPPKLPPAPAPAPVVPTPKPPKPSSGSPAWMSEPSPRISRDPKDKIKEKGVNASEVLTISTPEGGDKKGLWKPREADRPWTHGMEDCEAAAAAFDRLLHGSNAVVPNTVVRMLEGVRGSLQEMVPNVVGSAVKFEEAIDASPVLWANKPSVRRTFLNDVLSGNVDRHRENILFTANAEGKQVAHAIDNGYAFRESDARFAFPNYTDDYVHTLMDLDAASIETLNRIKPAEVAEVLHAHEIPPARIMEALTRIRSLQKNPGQLKEMIGYESELTQRRLTEWLRNTPKQHLLTDTEIAELSALAKGKAK